MTLERRRYAAAALIVLIAAGIFTTTAGGEGARGPVAAPTCPSNFSGGDQLSGRGRHPPVPLDGIERAVVCRYLGSSLGVPETGSGKSESLAGDLVARRVVDGPVVRSLAQQVDAAPRYPSGECIGPDGIPAGAYVKFVYRNRPMVPITAQFSGCVRGVGVSGGEVRVLEPALERRLRALTDAGACVRRWNSAEVGDGRRFATALAGFSRAALMTQSRDGLCILAFPGRAATAAGGYGVFVSALGGDYWVGLDPFEALRAAGPTTIPALERRAGREPNVMLVPHSGGLARVTDHAFRSQAFAAIPPTAFSPSNACRTVTVAPPSSSEYLVRERTVGCLITRVVTWAWANREGRLLSDPGAEPQIRSILGWRCEGDYAPPGESQPIVTNCAKGQHGFELRTRIPHPHPLALVAPADGRPPA